MLRLRPSTLKEATRIVGRLHRHCKPPQGGLWAVACENVDGREVGVAIVGRPKRMLQDGLTCEITRVATDGTQNACSRLYAACIRAARALGYHRIVTYTLASEPGTSLVAAGFDMDAKVKAEATLCRAGRHRVQVDLFGHEMRDAGPKIRWVKILSVAIPHN